MPIKKEGSFQSINANLVNNGNVNKAEDVKIWHKRLGHAPIKILEQISTLKVKNVCHDIQNYTVCLLARQNRMSFPSSSNRNDKPFFTIHEDVWRPYKVISHNGCRFFLTLVDDCSRMIWVYMLRMNSDVIVILR